MINTNILEKAKELGMLIKESNEYKQYKLSEEKFNSNNELQEQLVGYKQKYMTFLNTKDEKLADEIDSQYNELMKINDFSQYLEKKNDFDTLMNSINQSLMQDIGYKVSGGCGKCGGCPKDKK